MRTAVILSIALCGSTCFAAETAGLEWPQFRGPNADGISPETGINKDWAAKPPKELWRTPMTDDGYAGPSVAAGKLFIIDHSGNEDIVRAVDIKTGKDVWSFKYPDAVKANFGFSRSTPVFDGGKLYTISRSGNVHCLDAEKGTKIWSRNIKADFKGVTGNWEYAASPLVDGKNVIVCPGGAGASVVALDKETGKDVWKGGGSDKTGYATPLIATIGGKRQYVIFAGTTLSGVDPASGAQLWSVPWVNKSNVNAAAPIVIGDTIFITTGYRKGCALVKVAGDKATIAWENTNIQAHFSSSILSGGLIYGTGDPGVLVCLDPATGEVKWSQKGFEKGGITAVDGMIIAIDGAAGDVILIKINPAKYEEVGRIKPLGGQSWTTPIIADGKLFVRNKQNLVALDLK